MNTEISLEPDVIEVEAVDIVTTGNEATYQVADADLGMNYERREFNIIGDDVYIGKTLQEMPSWLQTYINDLALNAINDKITNVNQLIASVNGLIDSMNVAKNAYESAVLSFSDAETRMNAKYETLNSSMNNADATIIGTMTTLVEDNIASATSLDALRSKLNIPGTGDISALVAQLNSAIATESSARSISETALSSTIQSLDGDIESNATALEAMETYVGLDSASANYDQSLSAYLKDSDGNIGGADSKVSNSVYVDDDGQQRSKWEYGSTITVNGVPHTSGFGMSNTSGTNIGSEFWINADKFKMTNNNGVTPNSIPVFSIDTTDGNKVKFNGKVTFSSDHIVGIPTHTSGTGEPTGTAVAGSTYTKTSATPATVYVYNGGWKVTGLTATDLGVSGTTVIDGGRITTGRIQSYDGNTYFDLINNQIKMSNGTFLLNSTAAGTYVDPNIIGAYIKGTFMNSVFSTVSNSVNYGKFKYVKKNTNGGSVSISMPLYGSGFMDNRVTSVTDSSVLIIGKRSYSVGNTPNGASATSTLQMSINSGIWSTIATDSTVISIPNIRVDVSVAVSVLVFVYVDGSSGSGHGSGQGSGWGQSTPSVSFSGVHSFVEVVNLSQFSTSDVVAFRVPSGDVTVIIDNA